MNDETLQEESHPQSDAELAIYVLRNNLNLALAVPPTPLAVKDRRERYSDAILAFVQLIVILGEDAWADELAELASALLDLNDGTDSELFEPAPPASRADTSARWRQRAFASAAVEILSTRVMNGEVQRSIKQETLNYVAIHHDGIAKLLHDKETKKDEQTLQSGLRNWIKLFRSGRRGGVKRGPREEAQKVFNAILDGFEADVTSMSRSVAEDLAKRYLTKAAPK